jgi:hypothetical protein
MIVFSERPGTQFAQAECERFSQTIVRRITGIEKCTRKSRLLRNSTDTSSRSMDLLSAKSGALNLSYRPFAEKGSARAEVLGAMSLEYVLELSLILLNLLFR